MKCPKCEVDFEKVRFDGIEVSRCIGCQGIWFDAFKLDALLAAEGAEEIDVGDPLLGEEYNAMIRVACPRCGGTSRMVHMVSPVKHRIRFERCKVCHGTFLDAGEFKELKKGSLLEYFRTAFGGAAT